MRSISRRLNELEVKGNRELENEHILQNRFVRTTRLMAGGAGKVAIIYPHREPGYHSLAILLAQVMDKYLDSPVEVLPDNALLPERDSILPAEYRQATLFVLGNINSNRIILPLYTRYYCFSDANYPGGAGYELRTIINPYGMGKNIILIGGSRLAGVRRGVQQLIDVIDRAGRAGELVLPFLLDVDLDSELKQRLLSYPLTSLEAPPPSVTTGSGYEIYRCIGNYAMMYGLTGNERYAQYSLDRLKTLNQAAGTSYGDRHYFIEYLLHGVYWLAASGLLSPSDIERTNSLLFHTALGMENNWWRRKDGKPPLGHRHHAQGTFEFFQLARYLRTMVVSDPDVLARCDRRMEECRDYFDALGRAYVNDQDDETTLNALAICFLYALGDERYEFFESGDARRVALRALALHDNMGAGAGQGGYGESQMNALYLQQDASVAVATCAFYYQDNELKWVLENLPYLKEPLRSNIFTYTPVFIHTFATEDKFPGEEPRSLLGIQRLPITAYQFNLSSSPPEHIEPMGHTINAPETWQLAEGIGINHAPKNKCFDKITLRSSFDTCGAYLLLQGFQGGYRWQGHQQAANCIVRFAQFGHIFLVQNTRQHSPFYKNGVQVSNGYNQDAMAPIATWDAIGDYDRTGITITSLPENRGSTWKRLIFWSKPEDGLLVVLDQVEFHKSDSYSLTCTWRTPGYARLDGRRWRTEQGDYRFELVSGEDLVCEVEEERDEGACNPYILRQCKGGEYKAGQVQEFHNLFYARVRSSNENFDLVTLGKGKVLILRSDEPYALCGAFKEAESCHPNLHIDSLAAWITREEVILVGGKELKCPALHITCEDRAGMAIDLATGRLRLMIDTPGISETNVFVRQGDNTALAAVGDQGTELHLLAETIETLASVIASMFGNLKQVKTGANPGSMMHEKVSGYFHEAWRFRELGEIPARIREVRVQATPPPLDGFTDQLVDTVVIELRENRGQWPDVEKIEISLEFPDPTPVDSLRLVGDSIDEPVFRTYSPLPELIEVSGSRDGSWEHPITCSLAPEIEWAKYMRFRGQLDRLIARRVPVGDTLKELRLAVPSSKNGLPLVFQEIEVYGRDREVPQVRYLQVVDLSGKGRETILIVTENDTLILLDPDGQEIWRQTLPEKVAHLSCHELLGDGQLYICLGCIGGELRILTPNGDLYRSVQLADRFLEQGVFFGWIHTPFVIKVWNRDAHGRAALAVGGYSIVVFLDPDLNIIGHSWVDGARVNNILLSPVDSSQAGDLWVRTGWNHGIIRYKSHPGFEPSGASVNFGGVEQQMFREFSRAIPFVNGRSIAFEWIESSEGSRILAAAEGGVGVLDPGTNEWLWKNEGTPPISSCEVIGNQGKSRVVLTGLDGFISSYDFETGAADQKYWAGSPVRQACYFQHERLWIVTTHQDIQILDDNLQPQASYPLRVHKLQRLAGNDLIIASSSGEIIRLTLQRPVGS